MSHHWKLAGDRLDRVESTVTVDGEVRPVVAEDDRVLDVGGL
jgi:hypothetical protein